MSDLISRQEAIDALEREQSLVENPITETRWFDFGLRKAQEVLSGLPTAQPEQRWIPCSERLPEEERKSYWVCTDAYYQCECRWTNSSHIFTNMTTEWHWNIFDVPQYSKVVAWMPLPEPYETRRQDELEENR